jgi:hypothetical protein
MDYFLWFIVIPPVLVCVSVCIGSIIGISREVSRMCISSHDTDTESLL